MTGLSISNLSIQSSLTSALQGQQATLTQLSTQLATQEKYTNLTDYSASDARNLISLQSTATQTQAYISVIGTVSTKLSVYNSTMTDMESIIAQAQTIAQNNPTYSSSDASNSVAIQATNYLKSIGVDLNQQLNGQYIYAGTRYTTQPVSDLSALPASTLSSTIYTDGASLPSYDTQYSASALTMGISGQNVTIGGTVGTPENATVTVNNKTYSYTVQSTDTPTSIATALSALVAVDIPGTSSSGAVLTVGGTGTINSAASNVTNVASYTTDQATINTGYNVNYGVSSNNPAIQQMVAGLRYLQAAGNATDATTYASDMQQATTLLSSASSGLQTLNTSVAYNIDTMTTEKANQNASITDLTNQVSDIQSVDVTQVSTEITQLQTILQASYAVTGDIEKMSIVSYLPT